MVLEENARIQQSVWDPDGQSKLGVHQLLLGTATDGWRILPFKISLIQPVSSICPIAVVDQKVEPYGTGSAGEYVGNIWSPNSDRLRTNTSELYICLIVYICRNPSRGLPLFSP